MKYLSRIVGLVIVFGVASSALATQLVELDGSEYWRSASDQALFGLQRNADGLTIRQTHAMKRASFTSPIIKTPFAFTALGSHWQVETPGGSRFKLFISTSIDGHNFGPYRLIAPDGHLDPPDNLPDGAPNPRAGETLGQLYLHPRSDGQFFRYRITLSKIQSRGSGPTVKGLGFSVIDARVPTQEPTRSAPSHVIADDYPRPPVISRATWGARPATCNFAYCSTTHIGVHHTASVSDYTCSGFSECAAFVRAVQTFHMDGNGWCDVGYNYLATADGTLWEGRGGGDDVRGAHDGHNCGSMGVANLGFFHPPFNQLWSNAQQEAVAELSAWKSSRQGIDPFGVSFYAGLGAVNDNVYGHRDVSATACPGDNIYDFLPDLRSLIDAKLNADDQPFIYDTAAANVISGNWTTGTSSIDKFGPDYLWASTGNNHQVCAWNLDFDGPGHYQVSLWWPAGGNRSPVTQVFIKRSRDEALFAVDQRVNGGQWNVLGAFLFERGEVTIGVSNAAPGGDVVMCDALRLVPLH